MNLITIILLAFLVLILLAFVIALKIIFTFNSDKSHMDLTLLWLYPFVKAIIKNEEYGLALSVYVFNKKIYGRSLSQSNNGRKGLDLIKQVRPHDVNVNASYGFRDPFLTGVACGAINIASQFINIDSIKQNPEFVADSDYIYVDATAKVNLGSALISLFKMRRAGMKRKNSYA